MPDTHDVIVSVATGHAFPKHGGEFSDSGFGSTYPMNTEADLVKVMQDIIDDPQTRAVYNLDTNEVKIINTPQKVEIGLWDSRQYQDAGSVFRPNSPDKKWNKFIDEAGSKNQTLIFSRDPQDVRAMVERFAQTEDFSPKTLAKMQEPGRASMAQALRESSPPVNLTRLNDYIEDTKLNFAQQAETAKTERRAAQELGQERANMLKGLKEHVIGGADVVADKATGNILVEAKDGTFYEIAANTDTQTAKVTMTSPTGETTQFDIEGRQFDKLIHTPHINLKGLAGNMVGPAMVGAFVFAQTGNAQAATAAAAKSVAGYSIEAAENQAGMGEQALAAAKDVAAFTAPQTVEAVHNGKGAMHIVSGAINDTANALGCAVGSVPGAAMSAASLKSPIPGGLAGCVLGASVTDQIIKRGSDGIGNVICYFACETDEISPSDLRLSIPTDPDTLARQPEMEALREFSGSDEMLKGLAAEMRDQGSDEFVIPQLEERAQQLPFELPVNVPPGAENFIRPRPQTPQLAPNAPPAQPFEQPRMQQ